MTSVTQLFVIAAVLAAALALISIWAPRRIAIKGVALSTAVLFLPVSYASLVDLLSKPKPVDLEWWQNDAAEAEVLASRLIEDQAIYLWLQLPDMSEPRAYVLPWDRASAEQLQQAMRDAEQQGSGVQMRLPFEPSLEDREPKFYRAAPAGPAAQGGRGASAGVLPVARARRLRPRPGALRPDRRRRSARLRAASPP